MIIYVDTSALVKRVVPESETVALEDFLEAAVEDHEATLMTSALTRVEIARRVIRTGGNRDLVDKAVATATKGFDLVLLDRCIEQAMGVPGRHLRALDALHVAAALDVGATEFITYDTRQAEAGKAAGIAIGSPS